ncbi:MAG: hypothetical protein AAGI01_18210 [Myxococcota bacterium]
MRRPLLLVALTTLTLALWHDAALGCVKACAVHQLRDASGCCVDAPTAPSSTRWSSNLGAHVFTAHAVHTPLGGGDAELAELLAAIKPKGPGRFASLDAVSAAYWSRFIGLEQRISALARACASASSEDKGPCVDGAVRDALARREALLRRATNVWRALAREFPEALAVAQPQYYALVGHLATGEDARAKEMLEALMKDPESPYAVFALLTIGEAAYRKGRMRRAQALFSSAARSAPRASPGATAYAIHMSGWCLAGSGESAMTLDAMRRALVALERTPAQHNAAALRETILRDLVEVYAAVGVPERAQEFFTAVTGSAEEGREMMERYEEERASTAQ